VDADGNGRVSRAEIAQALGPPAGRPGRRPPRGRRSSVLLRLGPVGSEQVASWLASSSRRMAALRGRSRPFEAVRGASTRTRLGTDSRPSAVHPTPPPSYEPDHIHQTTRQIASWSSATSRTADLVDWQKRQEIPAPDVEEKS
jgi:hypothetical protein